MFPVYMVIIIRFIALFTISGVVFLLKHKSNSLVIFYY
ncbi:hypothetical protein DAQ1742_02428 [Dickeya aquatica]|uniref:Uncharacterized protein n=1 Tax=Dickeya aquatica TaxID=1401087 RepID=A0A375ABL2_9GAMM|nr:hypothetical protein DAQ1742_02428 [Dickeya aquatica]